MGSPRHVIIALAAGMAIMFAGALVFDSSSDSAMQAVGLTGFFAVFVVFHALDERAKRREKKSAQ